MKKLRIGLIVLLATIFTVCIGMTGLHIFQFVISERAQREASALVKQENVSEIPASTEASEDAAPSFTQVVSTTLVRQELPLSDTMAGNLLGIDLEALQDVNPDVRGWFTIPGTNIDYPLLQGQDNDYYLHNTWDRQASYRGSVFLECQSSADLSDFNTIVYAHNLLDGTMFSQLHRYKDPAFLEQNPYVYIVNGDGAYRYRIFAAFEVPTNASAYRLRFTEEQKLSFLEDSLNLSIHDTGEAPDAEDHILTLSTCTGVIRTNRWVVQAVLEGQIVTPGEFKQLVGETVSRVHPN